MLQYRAMRKVWEFLRYPLATALFLLLAFPRFDLWPLAHVALVPLLLFISRCERGGRAFAGGFVSGTLFFLALLSWIPRAMMAYGGVHWLVGGAAFLATGAILGAFIGLFAWLQHRLFMRWQWRSFLLTPFLWTAVEFARDHLAVTGFPWGSLGTSQAFFGYMIQIADITGVYGVSFLVAAVNTVWLIVLVRETPRKLKIYWAALVGMLLFYALLYAELCFFTYQTPEGPGLAVGGIQGNIRDEDGPLRVARIHFEDYPRLEAELLKAHPETKVVILPENPAPFSWERHPGYHALLARMAADYHVTLLVNGIRYEGDRYHNSVYDIGPDGTLQGAYDKIRLVPFAERVPLAGLFAFARSISREIGNFEPGRAQVLLPVGGVPFGVFVCYEAVFPEFVRRFTADGAQVLVNVTNDAWFGPTAAPYQHFQHCILRAVENRRWLVRVANSGISAIITPLGRVTETLPLFEQGTLAGEVYPLTQRSLYVSMGDVFAWFCAAVTVLAAGVTWKRKKDDGTRTG
jgi:apolipoprotein N-acyltransferase